MKKFYLLFCLPLFLVFFATTTSAQSWVWGKQAVGDYGAGDEGEAITRDRAGNLYITGYYKDSLFVGKDTLKAGHSFYGCYLIKYDVNGNVLWAKQSTGGLSPYSEQFGYSVATDKSDNVYVTGVFCDTAYFGSYTLMRAANSSEDIFLVKYDSTGKVLWAKQSISTGTAQGHGLSVAIDGNNNIYVAGESYDSLSLGSYKLYGTDYFIAKFDAIGNVQWVTTPNRGHGALPFAVTADAAGNTYLTGTFADTLGVGNDILTTTGSDDLFIAKYNTNGKPVWGQQSTNGTDTRGYAITLDGTANICVTGYYWGNVKLGSLTLPNSTKYNLFVAKYDSSGKCKWAANSTQLNNNYWEGYAVSADKNGNVYVLGGSQQGPADVQFGSLTFTLAAGSDPSVVVEYDSSGTAICGSIITSDGDDPSGMIANPDGYNVYISGDLADPQRFGPDSIGPTSGAERIFIANWQTCNANTTSISEVKDENAEVKVYPNPSNGVFTFQSSVVSGKSSVEVYNVLGEKVYSNSYQPTANGYQLNLSNQPNGIYLYRVISETGEMIGEGKLVKQ